MLLCIISIVFCFQSCLTESVISPIDFGIKLADGINEKFHRNQYSIPETFKQLESGALQGSMGTITSLNIAFTDIDLFPDKEEMSFTFTSNKTIARQPFKIVGEENINGTVTVVINQLLIKILFEIISEPKKGRCAVKAELVDHELLDGAVTPVYQLFGTAKMADEKKRRLGSQLDSYVQTNLLPEIQKGLTTNLQQAANDAILDVTLSTFGGDGYKGCEKYIPYLITE